LPGKAADFGKKNRKKIAAAAMIRMIPMIPATLTGEKVIPASDGGHAVSGGTGEGTCGAAGEFVANERADSGVTGASSVKGAPQKAQKRSPAVVDLPQRWQNGIS